jgi:hypothetical protein
MSLTPTALTTIASSLATIFEDTIATQINRATVLLQVLPVGDGTTGKNISWVARFGSAVGGSRAEGAAVTDLNSDTKVPATLDFGTYDDSFGITGKALAGARAARNPAELANLFTEELSECIERLAKGVAVDLYTGAGSTDEIMGLVASGGGIMDTGVYANIDRSTYPQWAGTVDGNSGVGRALTFDLMRDVRRQIYRASGQKPDLLVTTPEIHEKYGLLFGMQRRYITEIKLRGSMITLDGGYQMLEFDGIPVLEDVDCPTGDMLFLNTRYVRVLQLPDEVDAVNQGEAMVGIAGTDEEQLGQPTRKLRARINPLGKTGDFFMFQLILYPQLQVRRPNTNGVLSDIDYTL